MASIHGRRGTVQFPVGTISQVVEWRLRTEHDPADDTQMADIPPEWRTFNFDGLKSATATVEVLAHSTSAPEAVGTSLSATLVAITGRTYAGTFGIVNYEHRATRDDLQRITYELRLTSTLTESDAA